MKLSEALENAKLAEKHKKSIAECTEIVELIKADPEITRRKLLELTGWSSDKLDNRIQTLRDKGILSIQRKWVVHCD